MPSEATAASAVVPVSRSAGNCGSSSSQAVVLLVGAGSAGFGLAGVAHAAAAAVRRALRSCVACPSAIASRRASSSSPAASSSGTSVTCPTPASRTSTRCRTSPIGCSTSSTSGSRPGVAKSRKRRCGCCRGRRWRRCATRVFAGRAALGTDSAAADADASRDEARTLLRLRPRDLLMAGFIESRGLIIITAGFGVLWETGLLDPAFDAVVGENVDGRGIVRQVFRALAGGGTPSLDRIFMGVGAFVLLLLAMRLLSMVWSLVRLHGFHLERRGEDLAGGVRATDTSDDDRAAAAHPDADHPRRPAAPAVREGHGSGRIGGRRHDRRAPDRQARVAGAHRREAGPGVAPARSAARRRRVGDPVAACRSARFPARADDSARLLRRALAAVRADAEVVDAGAHRRAVDVGVSSTSGITSGIWVGRSSIARCSSSAAGSFAR